MDIEIKVPNGRKGKWEVASFKVSEKDAAMFNAREERGLGRFIEANKLYKKLVRYDNPNQKHAPTVVMSNTPAEIAILEPFLEKAKGDVLVFGLGLGVAIQALLDKKEVKTVTVVEIDSELIRFVGRYYKSRFPNFQLIEGDAFTYYSNNQYHAIWFDIWDGIDREHLKQMKLLKDKWKYNASIRMCWAEKECTKLEREENKARRLLAMSMYWVRGL